MVLMIHTRKHTYHINDMYSLPINEKYPYKINTSVLVFISNLYYHRQKEDPWKGKESIPKKRYHVATKHAKNR